MKRELHAIRSLQDFVRTVGILPTLKHDNSRTQTRDKWMEFECQMYINRLMTEPHSPWQNIAKHSINDLRMMV